MLVVAVVTGVALIGAIWLAGEIGANQPVMQPAPARKKRQKSPSKQ